MIKPQAFVFGATVGGDVDKGEYWSEGKAEGKGEGGLTGRFQRR